MSDFDPRRPDESQADYTRRLGRANRARDRAERDKRIQKALNEDDEEFGEADQEANSHLAALFSAWGDDIDSEVIGDAIEHDPDEKRREQAQRAMKEAENAKGGFFGSAEKADRVIKKHQKVIKNSAEAGKKAKGGWCAVVALFLFGAFGGLVYGLYEGVTAVVAAL